MKIFKLKRESRDGNISYVYLQGLDGPDGGSRYVNVDDPKVEPLFKYWSGISWNIEKLLDHFTREGYILLKKEIKNDVDWLDAIQDNFKEGT